MACLRASHRLQRILAKETDGLRHHHRPIPYAGTQTGLLGAVA
jgi:hypothetical protein